MTDRLPVDRDERGEDGPDRTRAEFFALVSHELRTPLTSILGYYELVMERRHALDEETTHNLDVIGRNLRRLDGLVSDLLLLSQVEAGTFSIALRTADLGRIATEVVAAALPRARKAGIELTLEADELPELAADGERLSQMLGNLVSNALKFTPRGGKVAVRLRQGEERALIEVVDTGPGIGADERSRLFELFYRAPASREGVKQGVGLGLAIAKLVVDAHGGRIWVESEEGTGSTFRVELPLRTAQSSAIG